MQVRRFILLFICLFSIHVGAVQKTIKGDDLNGLTLLQFAKILSDKQNLTILFSTRIKSSRQVEVYGNRSLSDGELYQVFMKALEMQGYIGVRNGDLIKVVRDRDARKQTVPVIKNN